MVVDPPKKESEHFVSARRCAWRELSYGIFESFLEFRVQALNNIFNLYLSHLPSTDMSNIIAPVGVVTAYFFSGLRAK